MVQSYSGENVHHRKNKGKIQLKLEEPGKGEGKTGTGEECRKVVEEEPKE